ncbi:Peroxisomal biogenesis factor [Mycena venus]|uniref:Peroxisomal biogenesis factor n=1 Tax=Mycena venus TaxID=2733690 RepID=A0A8H6XVX9_9AGAR|nr:Peroxisomal biogenesis factor [Mycena venus]
MANLAAQVVLHPVVSQTIKVGATTLGRDKLFLATQNFARFYEWFLISRGNKADAARWTALKTHLALSRRLFRLGKPMEHVQYALRAALTSAPPLEQITAIARQIAYVIFLSLDNFLWARAINLVTLRPETYTKVAKLAVRSWLTAIILSIVNALIKTARLARETRLLKVEKHDEKDLNLELDRETKLRVLAATRAAVRYQLIIDVLDVWNPATTLGYTRVNDGAIGVFGFVSRFSS